MQNEEENSELEFEDRRRIQGQIIRADKRFSDNDDVATNLTVNIPKIVVSMDVFISTGFPTSIESVDAMWAKTQQDTQTQS